MPRTAPFEVLAQVKEQLVELFFCKQMAVIHLRGKKHLPCKASN
jgi:hypothetical protein